ncbi:MAG: MaoC/PaaZ C-terminal domain-containing protein [Sphingobium sp.]
MAFDPNILLDHPPIETRHVITPKDVMLYALGVGADELDLVCEDALKVLPTMAVVMTYPGFIWRDPALNVSWEKILHAETSATLHRPLPVQGTLTGRTVFGPILDKGADKGAIVFQTREIHDEAGVHIATVRNTSFLRGDGGFGGTAEGQPEPHAVPDRAPDIVVPLGTRTDQALLYRLASGDLNPLHADPQVARAAGFDRPILHGLATYGVAGRALVKALADGDPTRIRRIDARFSSPVFPGETIETAIWREADGKAAFRCRVVERDKMVLNNGYVEFA